METAAEPAKREESAPAPPKEGPHWTEYIKAVDMFLLGLAGILLSIATFRMQRDTGRLQIEMQQDTLALQRQVAAAQLAANAIGMLGCKADERQEMALALISASAPQHVREITPALLKCRSGKISADKLNELGSIAEIRMHFHQQLQTAQEFLNHGHGEAAARYYSDACKWIPDGTAIDPKTLDDARRAFDEQRYSAAPISSGISSEIRPLFRYRHAEKCQSDSDSHPGTDCRDEGVWAGRTFEIVQD